MFDSWMVHFNCSGLLYPATLNPLPSLIKGFLTLPFHWWKEPCSQVSFKLPLAHQELQIEWPLPKSTFMDPTCLADDSCLKISPFRPPKLYLPAAKFSPGLLWCASRWRVLQHLLRCFVCAMSPEGVMGMASYQAAETWLEMLMQVYMISHSLTFCNNMALIWLSSLKLIEKC